MPHKALRTQENMWSFQFKVYDSNRMRLDPYNVIAVGLVRCWSEIKQSVIKSDGYKTCKDIAFGQGRFLDLIITD